MMEDKERILFIAPRFHTNQYFPVKALIEAGHDVAFFVLRRGKTEEYSVIYPVVFGYSCFSKFLLKLFKPKNPNKFIIRYAFPPVIRFIKEFKKFNPTIVIIRSPNTPFGLLALFVAKLKGVDVIFYSQGALYQRRNRFQIFLRSLIPLIFKAHWITPILGDSNVGFAPKRWYYVPFVVEPQTPPDKKKWFENGYINILSIGKFEPRKNHVLLLRAIKKLTDKYNIRLTIIGECSTLEHQKELYRVKKWVSSLDLKDTVTIKLNLSFFEVQNLMSKHDLFILPSRDEPAAISPLEAMSHSLPVICSDSNATNCYIEKGKNGEIFTTDSIDDLAVKIQMVIKDKSKLVKMGSYSYELVIKNHLPHFYVKKILNIAKVKDKPTC